MLLFGDHGHNMSLASVASGADGIMLEVHPKPEKKKSAVDPLQPINFREFKKLFKQ